jgi:hypothetical protein
LHISKNGNDFTKLRSALEKFYPGMQFPYLEKNTFFSKVIAKIVNGLPELQ